MRVQISSGQGPAECELAVKLLYDSLKKEYPDIKMISSHPSREKNCFTSIQFETEQDLSFLEGTIQWICRSPFRPEHRRKNWFVDVSIISEAEKVTTKGSIRFERFHSSGKGGQNVNKVETGVRLIHEPTGIVVTSTAERSQNLNKKDAMKKLNSILDSMEKGNKALAVNDAWKEHTKIVRGNPVRIYEGMKFRRKA